MKTFSAGLLFSLLFVFPAAAAVDADASLMYTYSAVNGDTLIKLANRFLIRKNEWQVLQKHNSIAQPDRIPVGTKIRIPVALMRTELAPVTIESARGRVESSAGTTTAGTKLKEGDQIKTGDDGFVTIKLADGSTVTVQSKSAVRLEVMRQLVNTGGVADSVVRLDAGRLETNVAKQRSPASRYEIRTPTSNMGVRGTAFRVGADDSGKKAQSEVVEGLVAVASGTGSAKPLDLPAGYGSFVEAGKPPSPPIELLPAPNLSALPTAYVSADLSFSFPSVTGANGYRAQVALDRGFTNLVAESSSSTPVAAFKDLPDGPLFFRARAIDPQGLEGKDAIHSFGIIARPFAPALESPAKNAKLASGKVTLSWKAVREAKSYRVQLAKDADFKQILDDKSLDAVTMASSSTLASGNYLWRVASKDAAGKVGPWSETIAFAVAAEAPLLKPKRGQKSIALELDVAGGKQYQVQISRNERFTNLVSDQIANTAELKLSGLSPNVYYVRIRVVTLSEKGAVEGAGEWSDIGMLEVYPNDWWLSSYHAPATR